jgi:hypothetical protein
LTVLAAPRVAAKAATRHSFRFFDMILDIIMILAICDAVPKI